MLFPNFLLVIKVLFKHRKIIRFRETLQKCFYEKAVINVSIKVYHRTKHSNKRNIFFTAREKRDTQLSSCCQTIEDVMCTDEG